LDGKSRYDITQEALVVESRPVPGMRPRKTMESDNLGRHDSGGGRVSEGCVRGERKKPFRTRSVALTRGSNRRTREKF
jgi:hypothetical protein